MNGELGSVGAFGAGMGFVYVVLWAVTGVALLIALIATWQIFRKAGYSRGRSVLWMLMLFIPIVNFVAMFVFAFGTWPIQREVQILRHMSDVAPQPVGGQSQRTSCAQCHAVLEEGARFCVVCGAPVGA